MTEPLFNPNPDRIITAHDLFDKEHKRNLENFKFRVSVYGVLCRGKEILVQRHPKLKTYGLPGGGVEIGENIKGSLFREFREETGLDVKAGKLITVTEDFFTHEGEDAHSVLITFEVSSVGGKLLPEGNQDDTGEVKFIGLEDLNKENTQRVFWEIIKTIKGNTK